ncbi:MAG: hypothetical protein H6888_00280 [Nitratireductor sp.]|nr:hypothetical protein [Nitratireductor sp.]MCC0019494.1 hypothetical protein [Nitratireductor sp.]
MPLAVLAPLVIVGIAIVVLLVRMAFGSNRHVLENEGEAVDSLTRDYPECRVAEVIMAQDRHAALLLLSSPPGSAGYVQAFGARNVTRLFSAADVRKWQKRGTSGVRIYFADAGLPMTEMEFSGEADAATAWKMLEEMTA